MISPLVPMSIAKVSSLSSNIFEDKITPMVSAPTKPDITGAM